MKILVTGATDKVVLSFLSGLHELNRLLRRHPNQHRDTGPAPKTGRVQHLTGEKGVNLQPICDVVAP